LISASKQKPRKQINRDSQVVETILPSNIFPFLSDSRLICAYRSTSLRDGKEKKQIVASTIEAVLRLRVEMAGDIFRQLKRLFHSPARGNAIASVAGIGEEAFGSTVPRIQADGNIEPGNPEANRVTETARQPNRAVPHFFSD
jgi:hypothetical protein